MSGQGEGTLSRQDQDYVDYAEKIRAEARRLAFEECIAIAEKCAAKDSMDASAVASALRTAAKGEGK